jgi:hypothetical protein
MVFRRRHIVSFILLLRLFVRLFFKKKKGLCLQKKLNCFVAPYKRTVRVKSHFCKPGQKLNKRSIKCLSAGICEESARSLQSLRLFAASAPAA